MRTGLLFIGGLYPPDNTIDNSLSRSSFVIAADSGYDYCRRRGIECDLVVGDMDSTRYSEEIAALGEERVKPFERDKDETDTEIGLRLLYEYGIEYPVIIGGGGGRLDHLLALAVLFDRRQRPREWLSREARVVSVEEEITLKGLKGRTVSLFPAGREVCRLHSEGLKWPLDQLQWLRGRGDAGISNEVIGEPLRLAPLTGRGILVIPESEESRQKQDRIEGT
jgi:thiamine pyrophosphokinase